MPPHCSVFCCFSIRTSANRSSGCTRSRAFYDLKPEAAEYMVSVWRKSEGKSEAIGKQPEEKSGHAPRRFTSPCTTTTSAAASGRNRPGGAPQHHRPRRPAARNRTNGR